jgi:hypothetical protein
VVRIPDGDGVRKWNPRKRVRSGFGVGAGPEPDRAVIMGRNRNRNGAGGGPEPVHGGGWGRGRPPLTLFLPLLPSGFPVTHPPALLYSTNPFRSRIAFPFPFVFLHFSYTNITYPPLVIRHLRSFCGMLVIFFGVWELFIRTGAVCLPLLIQTKKI